MPKLNFKFNKEKDLYNHWETANSDSKFVNPKKQLNPEIYKLCKGVKFEAVKKELEKNFKRIHSSHLIEIYINSLSKAWEKMEDEYFKRLEKITGKKFPFDKVDVYITTSKRCPYNYKTPWFMVSLFSSLPNSLKTCGHELMHLHFHMHYWKNIENQIGKEKTADLKEALTSLLNLEFKDLWFAIDGGYELHEELRKFIVENWKKEKDFDKLLENCVGFLK